ncbi:MAG: phosphate transport system substrate-binding protein [Solirubrobacterales bacterium]|nr:phosphate transport system substrate-binding protein [Solirubrobacterales bacterium]
MRSRKLGFALAASAVLALGVAACGSSSSSSSSSSSNLSGEIAGAGSSAQQAAQEAWIADFQNANSGVTISYDPVGSGGGREQFIGGGIDYAGSDAPLDSTELPGATKNCAPGELVEIPAYVSPIAIIYNLQGVDNLQLSPSTTAQIFNQKITTWNDPAIAKDNPGVTLPSTKITPVNRSDDSGTTQNFTEYLKGAAPADWPYDPAGTWPVKGGEAAAQTSGVVEAVTAGDGTIGYADESQASGLGIAKVKVGNTYVAPSAAGAAKDLELSKKDPALSQGKNVFAYTIDRTSTDPSAYPVLLVSYLIGCTHYDSASKAAIVKGYFNYIVSPAGQQSAAKTAGSAPISDAVRKQIQPAVDAIKG